MSFGYTRFCRSRARLSCVFGYWAVRVLGALLVSSPLARQLASHVRNYAEGDALLFEPGGMLLLDALGRTEVATQVALGDALLLGCVVLGVSAVAHLALVSSLALPRAKSSAAVLANLLTRWKGQLGLSTLYWLLFAVWGLAALLLLTLVGMLVGSLCSEPFVEMALLGTGLLLFTASALLQPWLDLARAAHATGQQVGDAATTAFVALWRRPLRCLGSWLAMTLAGAVCVALAAWWSLSSGTPRNADAPWLAIFVQQLAFSALTLSRVAWLSDAAALMTGARMQPLAQGGQDGLDAVQRVSS